MSASRSSRLRLCTGRVGQPAAQVGDLGLQEPHLAGELVGAAAARAGNAFDVAICVTSCFATLPASGGIASVNKRVLVTN